MSSNHAESQENALAVVLAIMTASAVLIGVIQYPQKNVSEQSMSKYREITIQDVKAKIEAIDKGVTHASR